MTGREPCRFCGAEEVEAGTTCPRSIVCPACGAAAGHPCKRPSGHRAAQLHAGRIREAEELDDARALPAGQLELDGDGLLADPADHEVDCVCEACTDQWRPEDAAPTLLEAERYMARAAVAGDPRGERDR